MSELLKISIIAPSNLPVPSVLGGAVETLIDHFINENEKKKRYQITVFSMYNKDAFELSKKYKNTSFIYLNKPFKINYTIWRRVLIKFFNTTFISPYLKELFTKIKKHESDLIIIEGEKSLITPIAKIKKKTPIWFHIHSNSFSTFNKTDANTLSKCKRIVSVSNFVKNEICNNHKISPNKISVIHNCVNIDDFTLNTQVSDLHDLKTKYNINNEIILIYTGRIIAEKGITELIKAFKQIPKNQHVKLLLIGSFGHSFGASDNKTNFHKEIKELIKDFNDKIIFTGFIPNNKLKNFYSISDIAIVPTTIYEEAAPLSIIESRVAGIPLITSDSGGIPEYANDKCAIIVKRGKNFISDLSKAMLKLIEDKELRQQMKEYNKKTIDEFSTERYFNEFSKLIDEEFNK